MTGLIQPLQLLARGTCDAARTALRRAVLIGAALLIAIMGAGFLILAAYLGLRFLLGPGLAALVLGVALLAVSAGLFLTVRAKVQIAGPQPLADPPQRQPITAPPASEDAATLAVFTMAFLLGRRLADRWGQDRES
jgi:hypothetical protein